MAARSCDGSCVHECVHAHFCVQVYTHLCAFVFRNHRLASGIFCCSLFYLFLRQSQNRAVTGLELTEIHLASASECWDQSLVHLVCLFKQSLYMTLEHVLEFTM